jgi:isocitrate dehydrogenase
VKLLKYIGQPDVAERIHNAWLRTIEDGVLTADLAAGGEAVGTMAFAEAVVARLGQLPRQLVPVAYDGFETVSIPPVSRRPSVEKVLHGVDVFLDNASATPDEIGKQLESLSGSDLKLTFISNRGVKVYPDGLPETFCTDHWRCRFERRDHQTALPPSALLKLLGRVGEAGLDWVKLENLYWFDGEPGYSLGQGQ